MKNIYTTFNQIKDRQSKELYLKQKSKVIWFTGLSGSGKTTLASLLEQELFRSNFFTQVLDGDNIRSGINSNLGFSEEDRLENIRRIAEVSKLFLDCGVIVLCSFISPTNQMRNIARNIIGKEDFLEIFVNTPLEVCEKRDPKGLYKKARKGEIPDFTGISSPFENPENPFMEIDNTDPDLEKSVSEIFNKLLPKISYNPQNTTTK